ncbi:hypothetical protein TH606_03075 [Thermodesulfatator autotrophicus]|uniref:Uncharacterized protein n=1 Tax=Thermodesulfatator autotrophicus TaxID=1795632 RepID=A0A177E8V2_9BACT|nr:hypothetical protein TH606_03075 [Thermodesulfatator autotrophicus]
MLPKAACGHLVQGLIHNFSGPLQIISMQLEMLKFYLARQPENEISKTLLEKFSQMEDQIKRLKDLLDAANIITQETPSPLNLNEILEKMLIFWEADLKFKHDITKIADFAEEISVVAPPAKIYRGFCALFWALVPFAVKNKTAFKIRTFNQNTPVVEIELDGAENLPEDDMFFTFAKEILSPFFVFDSSGNKLKLVFNPS